MKQIKKLVLLTLLVSSFPSFSNAQFDDDLYVFGFSQTIFTAKELSYEFYETENFPVTYSNTFRSNSFALHQVNLFFRKPINDKSVFFLNFEATGSYSSKTPSGHFEIPEGWLSYRFSNLLEVKAGLLLPKFNNLTEIKNRLPLFPYLIRPLLYETIFTNFLNPEDYNPQNAYFQISGELSRFNFTSLEYALYIGNAEHSYLTPEEELYNGNEEYFASFYLGESINTTLLIGSRIGLINDFETFKTGISFTIDEDDRNKEVRSLFKVENLVTPVLGDVRRYRLGYDLSFTKNKFAFEMEYFGVFHDHSEIRKTPSFAQANLNKYFIYGNITHNFSDQFYLFSQYSLLKEYTFEFVTKNSPNAAGLQFYSIGGGIKPFDGTSIKVQYLYSAVGNNDILLYNFKLLSIGISTIF